MSYERLVNFICIALGALTVSLTVLSRVSGGEAESASKESVNAVTYSYDDADIMVPLPEGIGEDRISVQSDLFSEKIWIDINGVDRGYFFKNPYRGESEYLSEAGYSEITGGIRMNISVSTPRVGVIRVEEGAMYVSFLTPSEAYGSLVVVDPGHGGVDRGTGAGDLYEADVVLDLAGKLSEKLSEKGIGVALARGDERYPMSEAERLHMADEMGADLYISLHADADPFSSVTGGVKVEYIDNEAGSRAAKALLYRLIAAEINMCDKLAEPVATTAEDTQMPCVYVEAGYLSNRADVLQLSDEAYLEKLAAVLARGAEVYLDER